MNKLVEFDLAPHEAFLLNNILVEHCMSMVEVVNSQPTEEAAAKAMEMLRVSAMAQQCLFSNTAKRETTYPEPIILFYRPIVEAAFEAFKEVKDQALASGDLSALKMGETEDLLASILKKIPEPSRIIV